MKKILFCLLTTLPFLAQANEPTIQSLLKTLDQTIKNRDIYSNEKEQNLREIKSFANYATDPEQKFLLYGQLFDSYRGYNTDSAFHYVNKKADYIEIIQKKEFFDDVTMNLAEVMMYTGMYKEAFDYLNSINIGTLKEYLHPYYYHLFRTVYGLMADYAVTPKEKNHYLEMTDRYRDSLMVINQTDTIQYLIVKSDQLIVHQQYQEALQMLLERYEKYPADSHDRAILAYSISEAYQGLGNREKEKEFLAYSALFDLRLAVKEYKALSRLSHLLYEDGDIDRSYNYLKCSMEDANFCNARHRVVEVNQIFPIIDNAYLSKTRKQQRQMLLAIVCISILTIFLFISILYVYKQMKKLALARKELSDANDSLRSLNQQLKTLNDDLHLSNEKLKETNITLSDSNYIKEEYIGRYMDQCSVYLEKMDNYRRSLGKIASTGKVEELYKTIKSNKLIEDELKEFYANFDETFLQLFPYFVQDFNALLNENERIDLRSNESLNTELRIFALIRLGITDSTKISQFLRYSVTTIYNYRTKIRNKAAGERSEFEQKVIEIGKNDLNKG